MVFYATGAIVGNAIAPDRALATLPIAIFVLGMAACILPFGALARRRGRRAVFMLGTGAGVLTGLLAALAVVTGSFWLFCVAAFWAVPTRRWRSRFALPQRMALAPSVAPGRCRW